MIFSKMRKCILVAVFASISLQAGWSEPPVNLINVPGDFSYEPQISIDPQGNAVAVWETIPQYYPSYGENSYVMASYYLLSRNKWSTPIIISSNYINTDTAKNPQVGVDANGNAQAIWVQSNANNNLISVYASTYTFVTHSWSTPTAIDNADINTQNYSNCQISIAPNGLGAAVWSESDVVSPFLYIVRGSTFNGTFWVSPVTVSQTTDDNSAFDPVVGVSSTGVPKAIWSEDVPGTSGVGRFINGAQGTANNVWTIFPSPVSGPIVNIDDSNDNPSLAVDPSGNAKAIWEYFKRSTSINSAVANSFYDGAWQSVVTLQTAQSTPGYFAEFLDIGVDAGGNAVGIWLWRRLGDLTYEMATTSLAGTNTWTTPIELAEFYPTNYDFHIGNAVGVNADGDAAVVWTQYSNVSNFVETNARNYFFGTSTWSDTALLSNPAFYTTLTPAVAGTTGLGNPIALWGADNTLNMATIQASSFIAQPLPPTNFSGSNLKNHFATQTDYINKLTWTPSTDPSVLGYLIYNGDELVAEVSSTGPYEVLIHNRNKKQVYTYTLYAFNSNGNSDPVTVTVPAASTKKK